MNVLVSAYACEPGRGSEPGAGWSFARAAARHHDVWLLTRANNADAIERALDDEGLRSRIHPVYVELARLRRLKRGSVGTAWYALVWQWAARRATRRLQATVDLDVVHHVTFAADWMPVGAATVPDAAFVWGPVGGSTPTAWHLWRWLGARGLLTEVARTVCTGVMRRTVGDRLARRASLVVAQNDDVARRFGQLVERAGGAVVVRPNVVLEGVAPAGDGRRSASTTEGTAVFVGRLVAWKGIRLAVAAIAHPAARGWRLAVYGDGPQRSSLRRLAGRRGVADRVAFCGQRPRAEVLRAVEHADVFLFPSTHDSAPWAVGEAVAMGTPVVCLDRGGPPNIVGVDGGVVVGDRGDVIGDLARALSRAAAMHPTPGRWDQSTLADEVDGWYRRARSVAQARGR